MVKSNIAPVIKNPSSCSSYQSTQTVFPSMLSTYNTARTTIMEGGARAHEQTGSDRSTFRASLYQNEAYKRMAMAITYQ